ncbi:2-methylaconitate cis-trans isomerase PrpF [Agrobacterium larrymoorei]|uniref:2-methylaconitate cis-trans isomerase PrpF n=1 Tax=Agrobacterium larrymoorei TaxID=160699 RepID=A0AAF0HFP5_9HYPH|nr:2-methylaconitate cis-trans isomerase PrpF [Agrobacterium larrymoorei]WHA44015.1 2-methylaconitate cis-trans isomerase PrpF [Agrobacterium larrymoorei]
MSFTAQAGVRATYMRGGTSKGVFFDAKDLPPALLKDREALDAFMLRVAGSPDPYGKQIDGMGSGTSSTSKVVIISKSEREGCDVDYLFGAASIDKNVMDWSGNCGNLTSAVGPFAIARGMVTPTGDGKQLVRIWQANINKRIDSFVPVADGRVVELGDFELDGVTFPAAEIQLEFLNPGEGDEDAGGAMFPTGNKIDQLDVPGVGTIACTLINAGNPAIFIDASSIGLNGAEMQAQINDDKEKLRILETIRAHATVAMGLATDPEEVTNKRPHTPKIAFVAKPASYTASNGKNVDKDSIQILARIMSMGQLHHAMTGTGAVAIAVAGAIPGTIVSQLLPGGSARTLRFGHPSGTLDVGAEAEENQGEWTVTKAIMSRSARRLMDGEIFVPASLLPASTAKQG